MLFGTIIDKNSTQMYNIINTENTSRGISGEIQLTAREADGFADQQIKAAGETD